MLYLRCSTGSEYVYVFFFPGISYIALGKKVSQEENWENKGMNFCICLKKIHQTNYSFYQDSLEVSLNKKMKWSKFMFICLLKARKSNF